MSIITSTVTFTIADIQREIAKATQDSHFGRTVFHAGRLEVLESMLYGELNRKGKARKMKKIDKLAKQIATIL